MADPLDKQLVRQTEPSFIYRLAHAIFLYPIELCLSLIASSLRPIAPQLIPLVVFFLLVPLLVIPAVLSGVFVWYSRAVSWQSPLFFQYGYAPTQIHFYIFAHEPQSDGLPPYAEVQLASFNPAQPYDISLQLVVPTTQSNYNLGNFMTTLTLSDRSNKTLITVRKPVSPPQAPFSCPRNSIDRLLSCLRHLSACPILVPQL